MKFLSKYFPVILSVLIFIVYLFTVAPSVVQIDSGELAAVQATLGIAHPTGYPLFTIIGYIFSLIPLPFTKIFQLNLLAALYCSAAAGVTAYTIKFLIDNFYSFSIKHKVKKAKKSKKKKEKKEDKKETEISETYKFTAAVFGAAVLAFSKTFWFQSTSVEVYSLHLLLISLIILFLLKAYLQSINNGLKIWLLFAFVLALGFTNHMTTLLILPGTALLFFMKEGFNKNSFIKISLMLVVFFAVLFFIYIYLPLRASQNPIINWGNPTDFEKIYRHISGKQYQVWLFSSMEAAKKQFVYFVNSLYGEFSFTLLLSFIGLVFLYIKARKLFFFLLLTFLSTVAYSINYDIHDIDSYFLLAYIMLAFFAAFGALYILQLKDLHKYAAYGLLAAVLAVQIYSNKDEVNQSGIYTFEDYTKSLIGSVSENAIIFSYQWDYFVSASYYFQFVENYRKDVTVVDKELLRRSWYFNQLNRNYPGLLKGVSNITEQFLTALIPFERSEQFDANKLEMLYRQLMTGLVATNVDKRDFYVAPELFEQEMQRGEFTLPAGYRLVPDLFLFKVVKGNEYVPAADPDFKIRFPEKGNYYTKTIEKFIGSMLSNRAIYEIRNGKTERAKIYTNKIKNDLPDFKLPPALRNVLK